MWFTSVKHVHSRWDSRAGRWTRQIAAETLTKMQNIKFWFHLVECFSFVWPFRSFFLYRYSRMPQLHFRRAHLRWYSHTDGRPSIKCYIVSPELVRRTFSIASKQARIFSFFFVHKKEESNTHNAINASERCRKWRRNSTNRIKQWILKCVRHGQEQGIHQTSEWINENMQPNDKMRGKKNSGELNETKRWK